MKSSCRVSPSLFPQNQSLSLLPRAATEHQLQLSHRRAHSCGYHRPSPSKPCSLTCFFVPEPSSSRHSLLTQGLCLWGQHEDQRQTNILPSAPEIQSPPVSSPALCEETYCGPWPFLSDHTSKGSQKNSLPTFLTPTHLSYSASNCPVNIPVEQAGKQATHNHYTLKIQLGNRNQDKKKSTQQRQIQKSPPRPLIIPNTDAKIPV